MTGATVTAKPYIIAVGTGATYGTTPEPPAAVGRRRRSAIRLTKMVIESMTGSGTLR